MAVITESFVMCTVHEVGKAWQDVGVGKPAMTYVLKMDGAEVSIRIQNANDPKIITFIKGAKLTVADNFIQYHDHEIASQIDPSPAAPSK